MLKRKLPAGFIVQPVERDKPPAGADRVHELKHDGYRLIVHRRGAIVRLRSRNGVDYTDRLPAIVSAAEGIGIPSFTIDGEAVVVGPDGLSHFEELRRKESAWSAPLSLRFNRA
jgi:bifunctional non-homologous end joining protein LigD